MSLPSYAELPVRPDAPAGSSWGVWDDPRLGCLNLLTPDRVRAGVASVHDGAVFALNLGLEQPHPTLFGRQPIEHAVVTRPTGISADDLVTTFNTQSSSQWDGFRHVRSVAHGAYGGIDDGDHGMHVWAERGIAGRAVLADIERWRASIGRPLSPGSRDVLTVEDLHGCLAAQGSVVEPGDLLLVRTGWMSWFRGLDDAGRADFAADMAGIGAVGFEQAERTAAGLWDLHIAAIACDNPAVEAWPPKVYTLDPRPSREELAELSREPAAAAELFLHLVLLPLLGLPLGELWDLDGLAEACAADRRYDCLLTSAPLNLRHGAASPPNALAIR